MSKKRIRAAIKGLAQRGVIVDSGKRRCGQVVWMPKPGLTEERGLALLDEGEKRDANQD